MRIYGPVEDERRKTAALALERFINWRRTIRVYKPDPIPDEIAQRIVEAGRWAPTKNNQPKWAAFVVVSPEARERFVAALKRSYSYLSDVKALHDTGYLDLERYRAFVAKFVSAIDRVPMFVAMVADKPPSQLPPELYNREMAHTLASCGFAAENMLLVALAWGVGGGILTLVSEEAERGVLEALGVSPEGHALAMVLTFGYPEEVPEKPKREIRITRL